MAYAYSNFAESTVQTTITAAATSISIASSDASNFPSPTGGDTAMAVLFDGTNAPELVSITARSTTTLTVARAQESTVAVAWSAGTKIRCTVTAAQLTALQSAGVQAGAWAGNAGGTADALTLTVSPAPASLAATIGVPLRFRATATSTSQTPTLQVNSLAAKTAKDARGNPLPKGFFIAGGMYEFTYNTTNDDYRGSMAVLPYLRKTVSTTAADTIADMLYVIEATGLSAGITRTLPSSAALFEGTVFIYRNSDSVYDLTLASSDSIDGSATTILTPNDSVALFWTGSTWKTLWKNGGGLTRAQVCAMVLAL